MIRTRVWWVFSTAVMALLNIRINYHWTLDTVLRQPLSLWFRCCTLFLKKMFFLSYISSSKPKLLLLILWHLCNQNKIILSELNSKIICFFSSIPNHRPLSISCHRKGRDRLHLWLPPCSTLSEVYLSWERHIRLPGQVTLLDMGEQGGETLVYMYLSVQRGVSRVIKLSRATGLCFSLLVLGSNCFHLEREDWNTSLVTRTALLHKQHPRVNVHHSNYWKRSHGGRQWYSCDTTY